MRCWPPSHHHAVEPSGPWQASGLPHGARRHLAHLEALDGLGVLQIVGAVLTGYFASPEQVEAVANILVRMKSAKPELFILVDPVMGDEAGLYVPQPVAEAISDQLVPLATCITPNRFELEWLSGNPMSNEADAIAAARRLALPEVLATSVPAGDGHLSTMLITPEK
jgi:pyridoxine kinase